MISRVVPILLAISLSFSAFNIESSWYILLKQVLSIDSKEENQPSFVNPFKQ
ncbi:MAG: hypothetical protein MHPSP_003697, partial [Paramarteilia canceri]